MSLTPEQTAELMGRLQEAKAARHSLLTQGAITRTLSKSLDSVQEMQTTPAKLAELERYILELERDLGLEPSIRRERSRRVIF
jgi:hypothetical protein